MNICGGGGGHNPLKENEELRKNLKAYLELNAALIKTVQDLKRYKDALEEAGVISFTLTEQNVGNPEKLLNDILDWHTAVATDPKVNGGYRLVKDWIVDEAR